MYTGILLNTELTYLNHYKNILSSQYLNFFLDFDIIDNYSECYLNEK